MSNLAAYLELTKPRITALVVFTTAAGLWLAPGLPSSGAVLLTIVGTGMVVAAANGLDMYLERDTDALMPRTMHRPLPSHRLEPRQALWFGATLATAGGHDGDDQDQDHHRGRGERLNVQVGVRPFYLVEGMDDSALKDRLKKQKVAGLFP